MSEATNKILNEIRRSLYTVTILRIIVEEGPIHGYGIRKRIEELSGGMLKPSESTVYETLKRLEKMGLIESYWCESPIGGPMRKYYRAKEVAREVLNNVLSELERLLSVIRLSAVASPKTG